MQPLHPAICVYKVSPDQIQWQHRVGQGTQPFRVARLNQLHWAQLLVHKFVSLDTVVQLCMCCMLSMLRIQFPLQIIRHSLSPLTHSKVSGIATAKKFSAASVNKEEQQCSKQADTQLSLETGGCKACKDL